MEEQTIVDIPRQTHELALVEATSNTANGRRRERGSSSKLQELNEYAIHNEWDRAKAIYDEFPDIVRTPLTIRGDTALHVAVMQNHGTFVKELVNLECMTAKDLEIPNVDGNTAFCMSAIRGNDDFLQIMKEKNENLPLIRGHDGMLPVHLAVLFGYHKIAQKLTSENMLQKMEDFKDIERLFFMTINSSMYGVAMELFEKYPKKLVVARNDTEQLTALHMLARQPEKNDISSGREHQLELLESLCNQVHQLEYDKILELVTQPSIVLFDAVKSGNVKVVRCLLEKNCELLLTIKDPKNGRNLLHFAALHKQQSIFNLILDMRTVKHIVRTVDKNGFNVLHLAAHQSHETSSSTRPNFRMQRELAWYKEVEKRVPPELRTMKSSYGQTPKDVFHTHHRKLSDEVKEAAKGIANSGMVVAALIATVAFAAALTVPGDKNNGWFIVFILTNAVALFTSSASIISFLSIFTSPKFTDSELIFSMHPSLLLGLTLLFISIVSMVIAFAAASFLTFYHTNKWVAYVVALLGLLPIFTFLVLQSSLFEALRDSLRFVLKRLREGTANTSSS